MGRAPGTLPPTPRRLARARATGHHPDLRVARQVLPLVAGVSAAAAPASALIFQLHTFLEHPELSLIRNLLLTTLNAIVAPLAAAAATAILVGLIQSGGRIRLQGPPRRPLRLLPSVQLRFEARTALRWGVLLVMSLALWAQLRPALPRLLARWGEDAVVTLASLELARRLSGVAVGLGLAWAAIDSLLAAIAWRRGLRMTHAEQERDQREQSASPELRRAQQSAAQQTAAQQTAAQQGGAQQRAPRP
jgi:flagellar biosynthesis protein FlhB